jgi:hypothetical protein
MTDEEKEFLRTLAHEWLEAQKLPLSKTNSLASLLADVAPIDAMRSMGEDAERLRQWNDELRVELKQAQEELFETQAKLAALREAAEKGQP